MTLCSAFLLILLNSYLFLPSTFSSKTIEDVEIDNLRSLRTKQQAEFALEENNGQRMKLHEVHSGPNPINNFLPEESYEVKLPIHP